MSAHAMFYRETWVEVDLDAIAHNVRELKKRLPDETNLFAVVKANGYGHGAVQVAEAALEAGATYLAVAFMDEALSLRKHGITAPILVLGSTPIGHVLIAAENNIAITVYEKDFFKSAMGLLQDKGLSLKIHIKYDSGMGRLGARSIEEVQEMIQAVDGEIIQLEGIYTHFATADALDETYVREQIRLFQELLDSLNEKPPLVHCSNSAAAFRFPDVYFNAVRFGISMYGLTPSAEMRELLPFELKPAFSLHTVLTQSKLVEAGSKIGYGATYTAKEDEWIGTIPIGYADGWFRRLSGQSVLIYGERVPIVGRICMDQAMIRLSRHESIGTKVTLIGKNGLDEVTVDEIAEKLETINHEVVCGISVRVPRIFIKNGKKVAVVNGLL